MLAKTVNSVIKIKWC